jgi:hypothetical protein
MLIHCSRRSFGSELKISLQTTQFRQRITVSLHNTQLGSERQFAAADAVSAANHNFAAQHTFWHEHTPHML